ncbi:MAG: hypothetical protein Q7P63_08950 [Verrucomicrobiota bacterium JB022]|nr:hypothetical protein [Verrucomicrobiota bacterium JB022]
MPPPFSGGPPPREGPPGHRNLKAVPDDAPPELRELWKEVQAGRERLRESREAALAVLPAATTRPQRRDALAQWFRAHAPELAQQEQLEWELQEMQDLYRAANPPEGEAVFPPEVQAQVDELRRLGRELLLTRRQALNALGPMPSIREREQALERFRTENAARIEEVRRLTGDLKHWWRTQGQALQVPRGIEARREAFAEEAAQWRQERNRLRKALDEAETDEERAALIDEFREWQRSRVDELRGGWGEHGER